MYAQLFSGGLFVAASASECALKLLEITIIHAGQHVRMNVITVLFAHRDEESLPFHRAEVEVLQFLLCGFAVRVGFGEFYIIETNQVYVRYNCQLSNYY